MRNGYIIDNLTSVDNKEIIRIGGEIIEKTEGVIKRENFEVNAFESVIGKLFEIKKQYKDQGDEVMKLLVNFLKNSSYGEQKRKDIEEEIAYKSEYWMLSDYDEKKRFLEYWKY